ncbi:hypothetical protein MBANPS3_012395 [Mucor bainieri]
MTFLLNGAAAFLELESVNILLDTPVESLHTLLLGVGKYVMRTVFANFLKDAQLKALNTRMRAYKSKAYTRTMHWNLSYHKSFLGRDYKILVQIFPLVLQEAYKKDRAFAAYRVEGSVLQTQIKKIIACFVDLGKLTSLVYMEKISSNFDAYCVMVDQASKKVMNSLDELTRTEVAVGKGQKKTMKTVYAVMNGSLVNRLKTHILVHLKEDLVRFATAIHTETEKGEQFNKEIHDALRNTNRQNTNRDVAKIFATKVMIRHLAHGGFVNDGIEIGEGLKQ